MATPVSKLIKSLAAKGPLCWMNPNCGAVDEVLPFLELDRLDMEDAEKRLRRFAPLLVLLFDELRASGGVIESPLVPVPRMAATLEKEGLPPLNGRLYIKADHALPVSGSVKARGGVYEILYYAETLALKGKIITADSDYRILAGQAARSLFAKHTLSVGSTGNLGLSTGIVGTALGFNTVVHMSAEAREWKKKLLREKGVTVIEHEADYSAAVKAGREAAAVEPSAYFIDDEKSTLLFLGYSVAALRLAGQLDRMGVRVDAGHPLYVYIPCGVGGAPGGITFGLKHVFGDAVKCYLVEPVESPCMLLGILKGFEEDVSVRDIGLGGPTIADGLAVGKPSRFAGRVLAHLAAGICTVPDEDLLMYLRLLRRTEKISIEPSAAAGFRGLEFVCAEKPPPGACATHLVWSTGGGMVPDEEFEKWYD